MSFNFKPVDPDKAKEYFEKKMAFTTGPVELKYFMDQGADFNIIDVRAADDYAEGHIPGAKSIPEDDWAKLNDPTQSQSKLLSKDKINILYCYSHVCHLAARAAVYFASRGYPVMEMDGGFAAWQEYNEGDVEKAA